MKSTQRFCLLMLPLSGIVFCTINLIQSSLSHLRCQEITILISVTVTFFFKFSTVQEFFTVFLSKKVLEKWNWLFVCNFFFWKKYQQLLLQMFKIFLTERKKKFGFLVVQKIWFFLLPYIECILEFPRDVCAVKSEL